MLVSARISQLCGRLAAGCAFALAMGSAAACLLTVPLDGLSGGVPPGDGGTGGTGGNNGCKSGFADCNTDGVCEINIASDGKNCGTCGHDCQGSTCTDGRCDPVVIATGSTPVALALDDTYVYWINNGTGDVNRRRKDATGSVDSLATGQSNLTDIAVDDEYVYWSNSSSTVSRTTKVPNGTPKNLVTSQSPVAIALDATSIYWANGGSPGSIAKAPNVGGTVVTLAGNQLGPSDIAVSGTTVYFIAYGESKIKSVATSGGATTDVAINLVSPMAIVVDATYVYVTERGTDKNGFADGTVSRITKANGAKEVLAPAQGGPQSLAISPSSDFAYWGDFNNGVVMSLQLPAAGQPPPSPAKIASQTGPKSVFADATAVYWINGNGEIAKVAR